MQTSRREATRRAAKRAPGLVKPRSVPGVQLSASEDRRLLNAEKRILEKHCFGYQSPHTLMIKLLSEYEEWDQLVAIKTVAMNYLEHDWDLFRSDYQASSLLSKSPTLPTSYDREGEALRDFWNSEAACAETNDILDLYCEGKFFPSSLDVHRVIHHAREYLLEVLGSGPSRADLSYAESEMRFGPGATTSLSGVVTSGAKYTPRRLDVTPRLSGFGTSLLPLLWRREGYELSFQTASKFTTVPKNAKKNRGICIEPDLNVYVQLGLGALLRKKLRKIGLDLDTAADWNRYLASVALDWGLTTLDLSAASDSVSRSVVWLLLPERWAELLWLARVDKTRVCGEEVSLHKWSSMGNGYTFELETLLFWSVLVGCLRANGSSGDTRLSACFGDDLIFPREYTDVISRTLKFLGFRVNEEKTFSTGLFRESCGTDYFAGVAVRPMYFKGAKSDDDEDLSYVQVTLGYANRIRRWSRRLGDDPSCDVRSLPAFLCAFSQIPEQHRRLRIPDGTGDNGVIGNWDECAPHVRPPRGWRHEGWGGYFYREYFRPIALDTKHALGAYVATLACQAEEASKGQPMRGRFKTATTRWAYALAWPSLGPWR